MVLSTCRTVSVAVDLLGQGGALQTPGGRQRPVFSSSCSECTLPVFVVHLQLKNFLVSDLILIG